MSVLSSFSGASVNPKEMLWWSHILTKLSQRKNLSIDEARDATYKIFASLEANRPEAPLIMAGYFGGLTVKEPTVEELAGMAEAMDKTKNFRFDFKTDKPVVTAGGTGGDTISTINVTTPATIVAAACGATAVKSVAKAFSSKTGAGDLAATLGINIQASHELVESCVRKLGTAVWASAMIYPWMGPLLRIRDLPVAPIIFPLLGSLRLMIATALNPFSVRRQVRGTALPKTELIATVLSKVGYERALVPTGYSDKDEARIDEFSNLGRTVVSELKPNGDIETYEVHPEDFGVEKADASEILAKDTHEENARLVLGVLSGRDKSPRRDLILMNAGAVLYLGEEAGNFKDGYELACNAVDSGDALEKVRQLVMQSGGSIDRFNSLL